MKLKITRVFYNEFNETDNQGNPVTFEDILEAHKIDAEANLETMFEIELPGINRVVEFSINKIESSLEKIEL